ncbi:MAG: GTPase Era [Betaproteobacteria bacterium]|nr:GTPase Era [Betaproteobacteria bacterium]NBT74412.1 GTPase Era [Betaproteobacteria bacterium]NBY14409.1 GTPase Era [Betaproteobacteria bacterium]NCA16044.1 GTPase Era [Betaproteobacteria bacterium]
MTVHRCGSVAIVGRPNVGKSSLLNALVGAQLSITSRKAQTTRHRILGVRTTPTDQILFVDTPGIQHSHQAALNRQLNRAALSTLEEVDAILWVIEAFRLLPEDEAVLARLPAEVPVVLALNKVDLFKDEADKAQSFELARQLSARRNFAAVVPVSVKKSFQVNVLASELAACLPEGPAAYEEDMLTDRSVKFMASEIIREKLFRLLGDELPYEATVVIDRFIEHEGQKPHTEIDATIVVARASQKPMVIGEGGERIKRIGSEARQDIMRLLEQPVRLTLWVKVKDNWADDEAAVRSFGYE